MDFTLTQWLQLAGNLSFTSFLILCVGVLGYALYRLYLSNQTDWSQIQQNTQDIAQLNQNVEALITKIDQLISELHSANSGALPKMISASHLPAISTNSSSQPPS